MRVIDGLLMMLAQASNIMIGKKAGISPYESQQ